MATEVKQEVENPFEDFNWDFAPEPEKTTTTTKVEDKIGDDTADDPLAAFMSELEVDVPLGEKDKEKAEDKKVKEPKDNIEEDLDIEEFIEESSNQADEPTIEEVSSSIKSLEFLKSKGLVSFELEEGEELTDEIASEILEDSFDKAVEDRIIEEFKNLPQEVKDIVSFTRKGGNFTDLLASMSKINTSELKLDMDLDDEENQELVLKNTLLEEGLSNEDIETQIELLKDSGKLKRFAEVKFNNWKKNNEKLIERQIKEQEELNRANKEREKQYRKDIDTFIETSEELKGIKLSRKDKKELPSYIYEKSIKLDNGSYITQMQKDLYEITQDKENLVVLSKILKSGLDFSDIVKAAETKITKGLKNNLSRTKNSQKPTKSINSRRPLWEAFED